MALLGRVWFTCLSLLTLNLYASPKELIQAIKIGDLAAVKSALAGGTDANREYDDALPLVLAIDLNQQAIFDALLEHGVDVNQEDGKDELPLVLAAKRGNPNWVHALLEKGADVNKQDGSDRTALNEALSNLDMELVQLLLDKGAEVTPSSKKVFPPLCQAAQLGDISLIELLRGRKADIHHPYAETKRTPLFYAVQSGALSVVNHLILLGADVNHRDENGETPFIYAVRRGDLPMAKLLAQYNADLQALDETRKNALTWAAFNGDADMLALLSAFGIDPKPLDNLGNDAVGYLKFFAVQEKINAFANPLAAIGDGYHRALFLNDEADLKKAVANDGFDYKSILSPTEGLLKHMSDPLNFAFEYGNLEMIQYLFERGAPVDGYPDSEVAPPLLAAASKGRIQLVRYLLSKGAQPDLFYGSQLSPLAAAIRANKIRVARTLWQAGARAYGKDQNGQLLRFQDGPFNVSRLKAEDASMNDFLLSHAEQKANACVPKNGVYSLACQDVKRPEIIKKVPMRVNGLLKAMRPANAEIVVSAVFDRDGKTVRDFQFLKSFGNYMWGVEFYAAEAMKHWLFKPGTLDGLPVDTRVTMTFILR